MTSPEHLAKWNEDSDPWRLMHDGSVHIHSARWTGTVWTTQDEIWLAPDLLTAQRWADEINGRGGRAEINMLFSNLGAIYRVIVTYNPYDTSSKM